VDLQACQHAKATQQDEEQADAVGDGDSFATAIVDFGAVVEDVQQHAPKGHKGHEDTQ